MAAVSVPVVDNEIWNEFFDEYKNSPELWKVKSNQYKNKEMKNQAYHRLLKIYKKIQANANVDMVKSKVNNIKTCYNRELRKVRLSQRSAEDKDDVHVPSLWYYEKLNFLKDQESKKGGIFYLNAGDDFLDETLIETFIKNNKRSRSNSLSEDFSQQTVQHLNDSPTTIDYTYRRDSGEPDQLDFRPRMVTSKTDRESLQQQQHSNDLKTNKTETDGDIYSRAWALSFNKLDEEQKLYAKKAIDDIFILGQLKILNFNIVPPILFPHPP